MATTTNYGWETPDDTDLVKDGALAQRTTANAIDSTLGTALNNKLHAGLVLVKTQTIGTGVSSVTVTDAFSSTYDNYKIQIVGGAGSVGDGLAIALNGASTGYYGSLIYTSYVSNSVIGFAQNNTTALSWVGYAGTGGLYMDVDVFAPFLAKPTIFYSHHAQSIGSGIAGTVNGMLNNTTSYSAFNVAPLSGTLTGGTIAVYGYAKD